MDTALEGTDAMTGQPHEQNVDLKARLTDVRERIAAAAKRSGRRADDILLVAVTKYASMDQVRRIVELGQVDLAESRSPNLAQRAAQIAEYLQRHREMHTASTQRLPKEIRWHMIGHLQRNKVRKIVDSVRLIHSVDSLRLAEEIQAAATKLDHAVEVLVQVNVSGEKQKHGIAPAAARHLVEQIDSMLNMHPRGLMCMAPYSENPEDARQTYERCHELFIDVAKACPDVEKFNLLSMGMSNDYEVAVECGANLVRVGRAIFGDEADHDAGA